ncbi:MAG: hypothetical protein KGY45_04150, partial [Hadesarchaea archaeon]|nr:hypothetical protein [Hadesarchaea archaeon]
MIILLSLNNSSFASPEDSHVQYVIVREFSSRVIDSETGGPIDNCVIWGEIHSKTLYFEMQIRGDTYSYWIWDENWVLLKKTINRPKSFERYILTGLSDLLEPGKHSYSINASAPGYLSKSIAGDFVNGEETIVKIDLNKNTGGLTLKLKNKEGVISRS